MNGKRVLKITLIVLASVAFIYLVYGTFFKDGPRFGTATSLGTSKVSTDPLEVPLDQIIINLGKGPYSFLKAEISFKAYNSSGKDLIVENSEMVRRLVLNLASRTDGTELATDRGKQEFKQSLIKAVNEQLGLNVEAVYFRNFVLAR